MGVSRSFSLFGLFMSLFWNATVHAADVNATIDLETGKLLIPDLQLGDHTFLLTMTLENAETLTFKLNPESIANVTPTAQSLSVSASAIHGTWKSHDDDVHIVTFNPDGTYLINNTVSQFDPTCSSGQERGRYNWNPGTGVLTAIVTLDTNIQCGLSHPRVAPAFLVEVDGNVLTISEVNRQESATLTRLP